MGISFDLALDAYSCVEHGHVDYNHGLDFGLTQNVSPDPVPAVPRPLHPPWAAPTSAAEGHEIYSHLAAGLGDIVAWYPQGTSNAELLDAAGGFMIQNFFAGTDENSLAG